MNQTYGQKAVGLSFNPSGDDAVAACKQEYATAIDRLANLAQSTQSGEVVRMCEIAQQHAQTAQMWAVKALTWKD